MGVFSLAVVPVVLLPWFGRLCSFWLATDNSNYIFDYWCQFNVMEILRPEKFRDNGFAISEFNSNSNLAHIRANEFDETGFEKWEAVFCELSCVSLNFWKSRPHGEGHRKIFVCHLHMSAWHEAQRVEEDIHWVSHSTYWCL